MTIQPAPIYQELADDQGKPTLPWTLFFNNVRDGDSGAAWAPTFQNLGSTGTPTISGRYYKLSKYLTYFTVTVTPATDTTSTAGTTYIDNFPLNFTGDGVVFAVTGNLGDGPGHIVSSNNRIYVPAWTSVTAPVVCVGIAEAT